MTPEETAVGAANLAFYRALESRDVRLMESVWSHGDGVTCVHPGWHRLDGWEEVSRSWQAIFTNSRPWRVRSEGERVLLEGELAVVFCLENLEAIGGHGDPARMQATNVYRKEKEAWKMVHHHASPMPEVEETEEEDTVN